VQWEGDLAEMRKERMDTSLMKRAKKIKGKPAAL